MTAEIPTVSPDSDEPIERTDTLVRLVLTLLFFVVARVVEVVIAVVVLFEVGYALVTRRKPSAEVRRFANRALSYLVTLVRYLTYSSGEVPFPFQEFPPELDLERPAASG